MSPLPSLLTLKHAVQALDSTEYVARAAAENHINEWLRAQLAAPGGAFALPRGVLDRREAYMLKRSLGMEAGQLAATMDCTARKIWRELYDRSESEEPEWSIEAHIRYPGLDRDVRIGFTS